MRIPGDLGCAPDDRASDRSLEYFANGSEMFFSNGD
jgi:hypothetical protein